MNDKMQHLHAEFLHHMERLHQIQKEINILQARHVENWHQRTELTEAITALQEG